MNITIHQVQIVQDGEKEYYYISMEASIDPGVMICNIVPVETFEIRAAEYNFDPTDFDTILRSIIYGHYTCDEEDEETCLAGAPTIDIARAAHLARIDALASNGQITANLKLMPKPFDSTAPLAKRMSVNGDSEEEDPIEFLRNNVDISVPHIKVHQQYIARERKRHQELREERLARIAARGKRAGTQRMKRKSVVRLREEYFGASADGRTPPVQRPRGFA